MFVERKMKDQQSATFMIACLPKKNRCSWKLCEAYRRAGCETCLNCSDFPPLQVLAETRCSRTGFVVDSWSATTVSCENSHEWIGIESQPMTRDANYDVTANWWKRHSCPETLKAMDLPKTFSIAHSPFLLVSSGLFHSPYSSCRCHNHFSLKESETPWFPFSFSTWKNLLELSAWNFSRKVVDSRTFPFVYLLMRRTCR